MFAGIQSLPPGHQITVKDGRLDLRRYWDISYTKNQPAGKSDEDYTEELLSLLRESVRLRLRSDVPFGAFLSGGVDSSTIVALMAEAMSEPVKTFSVGFAGGDEPDELPYAKEVADRFGCEHHTLIVTADDFLEHAENVLWHLDQPIADQATVATHMVAKLARRHVKMVLTGEGGDELFAGYARYEGERLAPWFKPIPSLLRPLMRNTFGRLPGLRRAKIAMNALTIRDEAKRFANWFPLLSDDAKADLLDTSMADVSSGARDVFASHLDQTDAQNPLDRMLYVDSKIWLPDYLLLRGDKLTMANSLEARVPLLDHKLVEFAAAKLIPRSIIDRKKQGFPIPIEKWLRHEARPLMRDLLARDVISRRGLFNPDRVEQRVKQHESGYADRATELWGLMSFEMWLQRFVDNTSTTDAVPTQEALTRTS
jgi:asparagine synthase (glutamine-hydrolysing)